MRIRAGAALVLLSGLSLPVHPAEKATEVTHPDQTFVASYNLFNMNKLGLAALAGTPSQEAGFAFAIDRRLDTVYVARTTGPAHLDLVFSRPQKLHSIRLQFPDTNLRWSLATAPSHQDLETGSPEVKVWVAEREVTTLASWEEAKLPAETPVTALRLNLIPKDPSRRVALREWQLVGEQRLEAIGVKSQRSVLDLNESYPLELEGYFSGGDTRPIEGRGLRWKIEPPVLARMTRFNRIQCLRRGPLQVTVELGKLKSPPLPLEIE